MEKVGVFWLGQINQGLHPPVPFAASGGCAAMQTDAASSLNFLRG